MAIFIYVFASVTILYFCSKEHRIFVGLILTGLFLIFAPYKSLDEFQLLGYRLDTDKYNELGDFVGGVVGTFFSIIAVYLLYKTYTVQRQELTSTRSLLLKQQFETTFFSMLNIHSQN